jgi:hypothetical protein
MPEKRGKMRKIDGDGTASEPVAEKKQRKKWTTEETQMLVDGCNTVSYHFSQNQSLLIQNFLSFFSSGV